MVEYYLLAFKKYANFSGRARRKEFWWFYAANMIVTAIFNILLTISGGASMFSLLTGDADINFFAIIVIILSSIYNLAIFVPTLALTVRRFHDIGKSGWYYLIVVGACILMIIPIIGWIAGLGLLIWYLVMMCQDSQIGDNQYGADPKAAERGNMAV